MSEITCPLCREPRKQSHFRTLYDAQVCRRCVIGFANRRQMAWVLDWFMWYVASFALGTAIVFGLMKLEAPDTALRVVLMAGAYVVAPLLFFLKDGFRGCSPGKALLEVRVVDRTTGEPIGFLRSLQRNLILLVPVLPLVLGIQLLKGHRWGDGWARTRVIWTQYADHPVFTGAAAAESPPAAKAA